MSAAAPSPELKVALAPDSIDVPQLRPTTKGTLEPKAVGKSSVADLTLGVRLLVDMDNVAESLVFGIKIFPYREKQESFHLAEVYLVGGAVGGDLGYMGSLALCRVDYPGGDYDAKYDDELAARVRELILPGPKAYK
jgi:hypothetical protein